VSIKARRDLVSFDAAYFEKEAEAGRPVGRGEAFRRVYLSSHWQGASRSGTGSSLQQTHVFAELLPALMTRHGVRRLLDLPCGDFTWMAHVELGDISYVGADLVPDIVGANNDRFGAADRTFIELDLISSVLPEADLLLCRDCLVHLSLDDALSALRNIAGSGIEYLLTTTFPNEPANEEIVTGDWRPIDLMKRPFNLPPPLELLNEGCAEQDGAFSDKSLGLWRVADLSSSFGGDPGAA
jgi:hypothetical protein